MNKHPVPQRLKDETPYKAYWLKFGKKFFYIYEVFIREDHYVGEEDKPSELAFIESIKPLIGNGGYRLRVHHPFIIGISDTFKTAELAEREAMRRVRWGK